MQTIVKCVALAACLTLVLANGVNADDSNQEAQAAPMKILFIGNSYTHVNSLDVVVDAMLNAAGYPAKVERSTFGGWRLSQHYAGAVLKDKANATPTPERIKSAQWDYVVLQEQSAGPVDRRADFLEYGQKLNDMIHENCPTTKVLLYQTWGRCDGMFEGYGDDEARKAEVIAAWTARYTEPNKPFVLDDATIEALKDGMQGGYAALAKAIDAKVAPVGKAFKEAGDKVDLHLNEEGKKPHHPSKAGTYLAGCVFYKTLTGQSPVGMWQKLNAAGKDLKVSEEDAAYLEQIADKVVE